jgi:hypothetical protein
MHFVKGSIVSPRAHGQANLSEFAAVTVWTGQEYVTVNNPVRVFFGSRGGITVQGPYGSGTTVKSTDPYAAIVSAINDKTGNIQSEWEGVRFTV